MARVLAITGVPGTGKTTTAHALDLDAPVVSANELARTIGAIVERDQARGAEVVDEGLLWDHGPPWLQEHHGAAAVVVEGGLAHFCDPHAVVVLRCHPDVLRERLSQRDWPPAKVEENVMAEVLDAVSQEVGTEPAWELDTTDLAPAHVANIIGGLFRGEPVTHSNLHPLGGVDWTDVLTE